MKTCARSSRKSVFDNAIIRAIGTLVTGTVVAYGVNLALVPVITRLYDPEAFGFFGLFSATITMVAPAATLHFCHASIVSQDQEEAQGLFNLAIFAVAMTATVIILFGLFLGAFFDFRHELLNTASVVILGLTLFFIGLGQNLQAWCVRIKNFRRTANVTVGRTIVIGLCQLVAFLVAPDAKGLIIGFFIGTVVGVFLFLYPRQTGKAFPRFDLPAAFRRNLWRRYSDFPLYSMPQGLINGVSSGMPVILLGIYFGPEVAGYYVLCLKILHIPKQMIGNAIRQVFFQRAAELQGGKKSLRSFYLKSTAALAAITVPFVLVTFTAGPMLFAFAFGDNWMVAGEYSRWLVLWLGVSLCNIPSIVLIKVFRVQRFHLIFEVLFLVSRVGVLVLAGHIYNAETAIVMLSVLGAVGNGLLICAVGVFLFFQSNLPLGEMPALSNQ